MAAPQPPTESALGRFYSIETKFGKRNWAVTTLVVTGLLIFKATRPKSK